MGANIQPNNYLGPLQRIRFWYALLLVITAVFVVRLFYLQVIKHDYYNTSALKGQLKEYEIPAKRGVIEAHSGNDIVPIVLNETKYTLFADPKFITNPGDSAGKIQQIIGGNSQDYEDKMREKVLKGFETASRRANACNIKWFFNFFCYHTI
jgi:cell division protein FtsI/penicillin-binding protein 2